MLGELDRAEALGWDLLAAAGGPGSLQAATEGVPLPAEALAPAVRLAHVLHWQERFRDADVLFTSAITSASGNAAAATDGSFEEQRATTMLAFTLQHLGKSRFDEGRLDDALALFERALALRRRVGAPDDQIASSVQAIAATRSRRSTKLDHPPA
jgi:tetratricopeptide (TPR) repeat protein